jgi:hypothetical protein
MSSKYSATKLARNSSKEDRENQPEGLGAGWLTGSSQLAALSMLCMTHAFWIL